jgi:GTP cyclohydrolase-4
MDEFPDIQARPSDSGFKLTRVGITGVRKPVSISRPGRVVTLVAETDVYVDLPADLRGSHMSRNVEAFNEIVEASARDPAPGLEDVCLNMARELLIRHEYATRAESRMSADYFLERETPSGVRTTEPFRLLARATALRGGEERLAIGVEVRGMNACPCAMETVRSLMIEEYPDAAESLRGDIPCITHNQRNITTVEVETGGEERVEADDLVELAELGQSARTLEILKREDEARQVLEAHRNPKFVEDVVRDILGLLLEKLDGLAGDTMVRVRCESEESIHKHNAVAERVTTLAELRL